MFSGGQAWLVGLLRVKYLKIILSPVCCFFIYFDIVSFASCNNLNQDLFFNNFINNSDFFTISVHFSISG